MLYLLADLEYHIKIILIFTLILILIYEVINGFHDTSNSVVTVIYTCALQSKLAVAISGIFNFLGVTLSGLSVAYTIIHLLPTELATNNDASHILAMVFSMLLAAILWNLSTWYLRLPTSSSHALIGTIIGIGIINTIITHNSTVQILNIQKLIEILLSLIIFPIISLFLAKLTILLLYKYWTNNKKNSYIHTTPSEQEKKNKKRQPPFILRSILIISSAGVSFSHGANDGQKGIGLIMLLLIGVIPTNFIINMNTTQYEIERTHLAIKYLHRYYTEYPQEKTTLKYIQEKKTIRNISLTPLKKSKLLSPIKNNLTNINNYTTSFYNTDSLDQIKKIEIKDEIHNNIHLILNVINRALLLLHNLHTYDQLTPNERSELRHLLLSIIDITDKTCKSSYISSKEKNCFKKIKKHLLHNIEYAPLWIVITIAISLSLGTIIGWKRVAITIGEKIGKKEMTYAQGLTTQLTTTIAIGIASYVGMPVSTTHVLSSSMTGSMLIHGHGIQKKIVKNILISWILTLPIAGILSSLFYWIILKSFF